MKWYPTGTKGIRYRQHPTRKKGKKWDVYYAIRYQENGIRIEEGLGWASETKITLDKAIAELSKLREAAMKGDGPVRLGEKRQLEDSRKEAEQAEQVRLAREAVTFANYFKDTYLPQAKADKAEKSAVREEGIFRLWISPVIGHLPMKDVAPFSLERIKKNLYDKKRSDRTVQYALQVIRHVFNTARKLGVYIGENPTKAVKWPKLDNMKLRYLSITEAEKLLAALKAKSQNLHDVALLSLHCGVRFGEIAKLTWSCVNWEAGSLAVLDAKTGSRTAYLTAPAKAMLKDRQTRLAERTAKDPESRYKGKPDEPIFPKRSGKDGTMGQSSKVFTDTVKELGFNQGITDRKQKVTFHTLRHTFATHLYECTHDLYLAQRSLGHTTSTMTARYAKMSESRLREGAAALEQVFATNGKNQNEQDQGGQIVNFSK